MHVIRFNYKILIVDSGVAALNHYIYVVGGFDGTRQLSLVERYDTEKQVWDQVAPIKIARSALSVTVLDNKLYAMGGFDGDHFLAIVEVYDPELNEWNEGTPLTSGRSGHASAVIYQPSCISTYMDCLEISSDKDSRKPHNSDDSNGPPSSSMDPSTSVNGSNTNNSSSLASFSGSRCDQCNDNSENVDNTGKHNSKKNTGKF